MSEKNSFSQIFQSSDSWRREVMEHALDGVVAINEDDQVVDWNKQAESIFGWSKAEALGAHITDLIIPTGLRESHNRGLKHFLATGIGPILNKRIELEALHKSGRLFPIELTVIPIAVNESFLFYSFVRDISEEKKIRKNLKIQTDSLENSLNAFDIVDEEGKFIYVNTAYVKMWGYESAEEILGTSPASHCADPSVAEKIIKELKEKGECEIEFLAKRKDGSTFDVHMWARLAFDLEGKEIYPTTAIDITREKRAKKALKESEQKYHLTFDEAPIGICHTGSEGILLKVNRMFCHLLGYTPAELEGKKIFEVTHPDDLGHDLEALRELVSQKRSLYSREKRYIRKDGTPVWALVTGRMLFNEDGTPKHTITIIQDISEQKKAEEERKRLERQLSFLAEVTRNLLAEPVDFEKRLEKLAHEVVPDLADWCAIDMVVPTGIKLAVVAHIDPSKAEAAYELRRLYPPDEDRPRGAPAVIKTGKSEIAPFISDELIRSISKDEHQFQLMKILGFRSYICVPITAHGEMLGAITLISESRSYEHSDLVFAEELANRVALVLYNTRLYADAQKAIKSRDEFISICSHELKTPVTSMKLQFQAAERKIRKDDPSVYTKESVQKRVIISNRQLDRMINLIEEMLDLSRISTGKLQFKKEKVNYTDLVKEVIERFGEQFSLLGINISFEPKEESVFIEGDRFRLEQVASNLLTNAIKYGSGKPIKVKLYSDRDKVYLEVQDQGIGIDEENLNRIFNRFERAVTSSNISGLGLGLFITKEIVEAHGGRIQVESSPGVGSTFTVELPAGP